MEQEIRDAEKNQRKANESLTDVMAEQKVLFVQGGKKRNFDEKKAGTNVYVNPAI